jgi:exodeoxyribonuclease III
MHLMSWNVNGIRAVQRKGFLEWLQSTQPDILCLQETKAHPDQLDEELRNPPGYHSYWVAAKKKGYSGLALYTKTKPLSVEIGLGIEKFDDEGRTLIAEYPDFTLINTYIPSASKGHEVVPFKLEYCDTLLARMNAYRLAGKSVIMCGDVNIAHNAIDLARPKANEKDPGFLPSERAWMDKLVGDGYLDTFRFLYPEQKDAYSWWSERTAGRERNVGWRIDYIFMSAGMEERLMTATINTDVRGSDHCPVSIELKAL